MRLLFGREFSLKNLLILWDSLFASPDFQGMVEFVCIAMLLFVRDSLLCSDYTACLSLLLRYPETQHVNFFISKALFLRNPGVSYVFVIWINSCTYCVWSAIHVSYGEVMMYHK